MVKIQIVGKSDLTLEKSSSVKTCLRCKTQKSLDYFGKDKQRKDGLSPLCKPCNVERVREWREKNPEKKQAQSRLEYERNAEQIKLRSAQWYSSNKEQAAETSRAYRIKNRFAILQNKHKYYEENKERHSEKTRAYYEKHRADVEIYKREWYDLNKERLSSKAKVYRVEHKEEIRAAKSNAKHTRRARLRFAQSFFVPRDLIEELYSQPCGYCGDYIEGQMQIDHIIPISRGGNHKIGNLISACPACNMSKGSKTLTEWKYSRRKR